jgi:hypothetical protein
VLELALVAHPGRLLEEFTYRVKHRRLIAINVGWLIA